MEVEGETLIKAGSKVIAQIDTLLSQRNHPIVVALDGGSGAGKSTLAAYIAEVLDATVIPLDDFFSADIPTAQWMQFTVEEKFARVFDWQHIRHQAVMPLLERKPARWFAFDFESGIRPDGTYGLQTEASEREPADVILLDGAYSAAPQLVDLVDMAVLVDAPVEVRHARLAVRENSEFLVAWHAMWDEVESYYFTHVRPRGSFDLMAKLD